MPELQLFKRRWHIASDTLPVMTALLCLFHVLWFIPYATGAWSIESTGIKYDCSQGALLRVASYSLFVLFGISAVLEAVLTVLGLRGGPFDTQKRRWVGPLLGAEIVVWVLLLGFTIFATVVIASPSVSNACWSNNPCAYDTHALPISCKDNGKGVKELSPECRYVVDAGYGAFDTCLNDWLGYGANWGSMLWYQAYIINDKYKALADLPGANITELVDEAVAEVQTLLDTMYFADPPYCNSTVDFQFWNDTINIDGVEAAVEGFNLSSVKEYNAWIKAHPNFIAEITQAMLDAIGLVIPDLNNTDTNITEPSDTPWFPCLSASCINITLASEQCHEWVDILLLPNGNSRKRFFVVLVASSWAILVVTALVIFACYNAFPSYDDVDSWEGSLRSINRCCCCANALGQSADVGGSDVSVSREIAKSLTLLFGGIDLDPSDRLLGVYLVSERQHRRRQLDVLTALQNAGHVVARQPSLMNRMLHHLTPSARRALSQTSPASAAAAASSSFNPSKAGGGAFLPPAGQQSPASSDGSLPGKSDDRSLQGEEVDGAVAPQGVPLEGAASTTTPLQQQQVPTTAASPGQLRLSPFDAPAASGASQSSPSAPSRTSPGPGGRGLLMYQQSMLRLRSSVGRADGTPELALDHLSSVAEEGRLGVAPANTRAAKAAQASLDAAVAAAEPEQVLEAPSKDKAAAAGGPKRVGSSSGSGGDSGGGGDSTLPATSSSEADKAKRGWQNSAVRVTARFRPLLTPSGCAGGSQVLDPPLSPQAAADIYAGKLEAVDEGTLREAQRISRFAVASYGLQSVIWAQGERPGACLANANRLVKCFKAPLGLETSLRKQNFDAIVRITGVQPRDLLYVSYTNVAGGVLPYMVLVHRPSKSVVLSVRGTVSMEDLITDLLSNPVDVADWVPAWVGEAAAARRAAGAAGDDGGGLKAHQGIVSSAAAILKDMEERGLLQELLVSKLLRSATLAGVGTEAAIADFLASHTATTTLSQQQTDAAATTAVAGAGAAAAWPGGQQQQQMRRDGVGGGASMAISPAEAAAAVASVRAGGYAAAAAGDGGGAAGSGSGAAGQRQQQEQQLDEEQRHLQRLNQMQGEREVDLPLARAQAIIRSKLQQAGWKFVVTGHSLGAAVATLLGMHLRERFSDLQVWAFNPPGGLLSWELSQIVQCYCTSIVTGKDVISRLSFTTSKRVVDEMVVSLARCTRPKLLVMLDVLLGRRKRAVTTPPTFCSMADICPEALQLVEGYYRASSLHQQSADTTEMYPPGRIIFMRPFKGKKKAHTVWDAVYIDAPTLMSEGILITPSMMEHHRMFVLADAFKSIFAGEAARGEAADLGEQDNDDIYDPAHIMAAA